MSNSENTNMISEKEIRGIVNRVVEAKIKEEVRSVLTRKVSVESILNQKNMQNYIKSVVKEELEDIVREVVSDIRTELEDKVYNYVRNRIVITLDGNKANKSKK